MDREVWVDIISGLVVVTIPVATYIGFLDLWEWRRRRALLQLARAMTRFGWVLTVGAIAIRANGHDAPIEETHGLLTAMFVVGLLVSCVGFFGVARNYHKENDDERG